MKNLYILTLFFLLYSCGYPDIDDVPNFENIRLSDEEINDYCSSINLTKNNIENCINNYKINN